MDDTSIYSCDDHLDLRSVPPGLWQSRLPKDLVERGPRVVTGEGDPMWVCNDRVLGRSGLPDGDKLQVLSAVSRAGLEDDGFRVSDPKLRLEDMDLDGVWASVIYGPIPLTLSIPEPDLQTACYAAWNDWAIEEFNAFAPDRLCALPFLPTHSPEAAVAELERVAAIGHRGAIIDVFDFDAGDPAWDRAVGRRRADGSAPQLPHQRRGLAPAELPGGQVAVGGVRHPPSPAARRGVGHHGLLRGPRTAPGAHPGAGRGRASAGCPYFLSRMDMEWENLRDKIDYAPRCPERAVQASGHRHLRGGGPGRTSTSRTSGPTRACGRPTSPTPTARSPSRAVPSRRRWACSPTRTVARSPRSIAPSCTASTMWPDHRGPGRHRPARWHLPRSSSRRSMPHVS